MFPPDKRFHRPCRAVAQTEKAELRVVRRRSGRYVWEIVTLRGAGVVVRSSWPHADYETADQARLAGQARWPSDAVS